MRRRAELVHVAYLCVRAAVVLRSRWRDLAYFAYIGWSERRRVRRAPDGWSW